MHRFAGTRLHLPSHSLRTVLGLVSLSLIATASTGCVSEEKYQARSLQSAQLSEQLASAQRQLSEASAQNEVYKNQLTQIRQSGDTQSALVANQAQTIADLTRQRDDLADKYRQAIDSVGKAGSGPLPQPLTNELTAFAAQNPDQVEFDAQRGLVKFKSDFTFSPGSAEVKPEAKSAIDRLASILNGPVASQYDLMVVGHTDAQPVSNPATIKAGHHDNWYLSAHRAIGVSKELRSQNVAAGRIEVAGLADQRPVADNTSDAGKAKNRRVEVLLLPTTGHATVAASAAGAVPAAGKSPGAKSTGLNKDAPTVEVEKKPALNK